MNNFIKEERDEDLPQLYEKFNFEEVKKRESYMTCLCGTKNCHDADVPFGSSTSLIRVVKKKWPNQIISSDGKDIYGVHADLLVKALRDDTLKPPQKNRAKFVTCRHFDSKVLDDGGFPFSYIRDRTTALSLYGERNMRANAVPGKEELWFVLPTKTSSEQDDSCSRNDSTFWGVFKTPFSNKLVESNHSGENNTIVNSGAGSSSLLNILYRVLKRKQRDDENGSISPKRTRRTPHALPIEPIIADSEQMVSPTITPRIVPHTALATSSSSQMEMPSQADLTLNSRFELVDRNPAIDSAASVIEANLSHGNIIVGERIDELTVNILKSRKKSQEKSEGYKNRSVVQLKYKTGGAGQGRVYKRHYAHIPIHTGENIDEGSKNRSDYLTQRADEVADWIRIMCHSDEEKKGLLEKVVKSKKIGSGGRVEWDQEGSLLDVEDCIAIRDSSGVTSTRHICKVFDAIRKLKGMKSGQFHPTQLAPKIGTFEAENLLETLFYIVDAEVDEKKSKSCVFYYTPQIPLLMEMLTASSINDGSHLKSEDISFFKNTEIFFRGTDRGGGNTIDMVRLGNRNNGNCGKYCVPVSVLEGGGETYKNLKETSYNPKRSETFNMLDDESVYMFSIGGSSSSDEGIVTGNTRSIMVAFSYTDSEGQAVSARDLDLTISVNVISAENDIELLDEEAEREFNSTAVDGDSIDRIAPCTIQLTADRMQNDTDENSNEKTLCLEVKLCKRKMPCGDDCYELVGVHIYFRSGELVYSFKFPSAAVILNRSMIEANCKKAILIYSNDGKMNNCLVGLGTCSCKYSCINCIRPTNSKEYPTFVKDIALNKMSDWDEQKWGKNPLLDANYKDYTRRKDRYHIHRSWKTFYESIGRHSEFSDAVKKSTMGKTSAEMSYSIEAEPLIGETKNMHHMPADPLHNTEGTVNHLNKAAITLIKAIAADDDGSWAQRTINIDKIKKRVNDLIALIKNDDTYKKAKRDLRKERKAYLDCHAALSKEYEKNEQRDEHVIIELANREEALSKSLENISVKTGFGLNNRQIKGLKEFLNLIGDKKGDILIDKLDEGEYIFIQCIQTFAGDFAKQHGGLDLTARRSMKSLESREQIHKIASRAYQNNPFRQKIMIDILDWWRECSHHLFEVCKLTNSQEKMTTERLNRLKFHTVWFLAHWRRMAPKENDIYWKLHALLCSLFDFCEHTGMCGLAAAQGFENNHFEMNKLAEMLSRIAQNGRRVSKLQNRQQTFLLSGVNERMRKIEDSKKKFGARRKRDSVGTKILENIEDLDTDDDFYSCDEFPDGLLIVEQGGLLQAEFSEIYMYLKKKRVPESFLAALEDETELGSKAVQDFKFNST